MTPLNLLFSDLVVKRAKDIRGLKAFIAVITIVFFITFALTYFLIKRSDSAGLDVPLVNFATVFVFLIGIPMLSARVRELFASSLLTILAYSSKRITTGQLMKNWSIVYWCNFCSALFVLILLGVLQQQFTYAVSWSVNAMKIAQHNIHYDFLPIVALGLLFLILVCLANCMTFFCRTSTVKVFAIVLAISMFVLCHFDYNIANIFMTSSSIAIAQYAVTEFLAGTGVQASQFSNLFISNLIFNNLSPVNIGKLLGGSVLVCLTYWLVYFRVFNHIEDQQA